MVNDSGQLVGITLQIRSVKATRQSTRLNVVVWLTIWECQTNKIQFGTENGNLVLLIWQSAN